MLLRLFRYLPWVGAVLSFAASADAATVVLAHPASLPRSSPSIDAFPKRPLTQTPEGINLADCKSDLAIQFDLLLEDFEANAALQAWASFDGVDCRVATNRAGATALCWKLSDAIPLAATTSVKVPVRQILSGVPNGPADRIEDVCGQVDLTTVSVQFLYFAPGSQADANLSASVAIEADTIGPAAPKSFTATSGSAGVAVRAEPAGEGASTTDVFCDVSDGADAGPLACATPAFTASAPPGSVDEPLYLCASQATGETTVRTRANGAPLGEDTSYAFAARSVDAFGNPGVLSTLACAAPGPAAPAPEGTGEEGGCTVGRSGPGSTWSALVLAGVAAVLVRTRRRALR